MTDSKGLYHPMKLKFLSLIAALFVFAGLSAAQNCAVTNVCKVDQTTTIQIRAENGDDFCFFTQDSPEALTITCFVQNVLKLTIHKNFWAKECFTSNFGGTEFLWSICRTGNAVNLFSWDVTAGNLEKTGTLF